MVDILNPPSGSKSATRLDTLAQARSLPSYAGPLPKYEFDPSNGFYNVKGSNLRKFHAGIIRAAQGTGRCNVLFLGDSSLIGYNGSVIKEQIATPRAFQDAFAARMGIKSAGGFQPFALASATYADKFQLLAGTINATTYPGLVYLNNGASVQWAPNRMGTIVEFVYSNLSYSGFTYQIDGGTAVPVTTTGAGTWAKITITGLPLGQHIIRINHPGGAGTFVFLAGGKITNADGISCDNIAYGGTKAAYGVVGGNWTDTNPGGPYVNRKQMWDIFGITPDLVVLSIGANDISSGDTAQNAINGINTMRGWYPSSDFMLMHTAGFSGGTIGVYDTYTALKYQLADTLDIPLFDIRYKMGDSTEAQANGLLGADNAHGNDATNLEIARVMAGGLALPFGGFDAKSDMSARDGGAEVVAVALGTSGTVILDASVASIFTLSPTAAVSSLLIQNVPVGVSCAIRLCVTQGATPYSIATPTGGVFYGTATPTAVANKKQIFDYFTVDGGTSWHCSGINQV